MLVFFIVHSMPWAQGEEFVYCEVPTESIFVAAEILL